MLIGRSNSLSDPDKRLHQSWKPVIEAQIPFSDGETDTFAVPSDDGLVLGSLIGVFDVACMEDLRAAEISTFQHERQFTAGMRVCRQDGARLATPCFSAKRHRLKPPPRRFHRSASMLLLR